MVAAETVLDGMLAGMAPMVLGGLVTLAALGVGRVSESSSIGLLFAWILAGAALAGVVGWIVVTVAFPAADPTIGLMAGIALGGGVGAVIRLVAFAPEETGEESVTIDTDSEVDSTPQPIDLFEACPDPLVYYGHNGDEPIALAVNPAFETAFGSPAGEERPLEEVLRAESIDAILEAVDAGESDQIAVETADGPADLPDFRVRVLPVGRENRRGYLLYTPVFRDGV